MYFVSCKKFNIKIVGGGVVGLATAYQLQTNFPDLNIVILRKRKVSFSSKRKNSGVIHSGLYYKPGSLKAKNCVRVKAINSFC